MHCAGCISTIESSLAELPEVLSARVNLTQRRVRIEATPNATPELLADAIAHAGYKAIRLDASAARSMSIDPESHNLLLRIGVAGFGFANVMIFSVVVWSGADGATRDLMHWLSALIAAPIICYSAQPFLVSAAGSLRRFKLNMDVPISLAILLATGQSLFETALGGQHAYFEAALALTFFLLSGRHLDLRTRGAARSAAQQLASIEPDHATVLADGREVELAIGSVQAGDLVVVRSGSRIPLDGAVRAGSADIDSSFLTGESNPLPVGQGDRVAAGQFVHTGRLTIEVTDAEEGSTLRSLVKLVELAESAKTRYTGLADRAAAIYAPAVHALALAGFAAWVLLTGDLRLSLNVAVAVLIITCPCALGLAVPAVSTAATAQLLRNSLLTKEHEALERLADVRTVVLDKTGTLTEGSPRLDQTNAIDSEALAVAAGLAESSNHPHAQAILKQSRRLGLQPAMVTDVREFPGYGIAGSWNGADVRLGRASWVGIEGTGNSSSFLRLGREGLQEFRFTDRLRPSARQCVQELESLGATVILLSGDAATVVEATAGELGIEEWHGDATPEAKLALVRNRAQESGAILMVGDGLNDAAALASADVSLAPSSALDATRVAADIVLVGGDLARIPEGIRLARKAKRRVLENFAIAASYNFVAVPLALAGIATPLAAAIAMSTSSIAVTLNSFRMR